MKNIILVGMPCSGKSTLGKILSEKLKYKLIDTDNLIEKNENMSISSIFEEKGEDYFRKKEHEIIDHLETCKDTVIVCGGGMAAYYDNMDRLNKIGTTIFLNVELDELKKRALKVGNRPLLIENSHNVLNKLYEERIKFYRKAHIIINENSGIDDIMTLLINKY